MRNLNEELALLVQHRLNHGVLNTRLVNCSAQSVSGRRLLEPHRNHGPALEIDAKVESFRTVRMELVPVKSGAHPCQHQHDGDPDKETPLTEPINIYLVK